MAAAVVMTTRPLWLQNATGYTALDMRGVADAAFDEGVDEPGDLLVAQRAAGTNMSVDVAVGTAVITGDSPSGSRSYLVRSDAVTNVTLDAAPASNSRVDLIIARVRDAAVGGGANNDWTLEAVTGTSGASPAPATLPTSAIELARVLVTSGTSAITNAMVTDRRYSMHRLVRAAANPAQLRDGQIISRTDNATVMVVGSGSALNILAGIPSTVTHDGALFERVGHEYANGGTMIMEWGQKLIPFTDGRGRLHTAHTFNGFAFSNVFGVGNQQVPVFGRRTTSGDDMDVNTIPLTCVYVSALGNAAPTGSITCNYLVIGW